MLQPSSGLKSSGVSLLTLVEKTALRFAKISSMLGLAVFKKLFKQKASMQKVPAGFQAYCGASVTRSEILAVLKSMA